MSSTTTIADVATKINSVTNNGAISKTFTPSTSSQSYNIPKGYHNGNGKVTCNAVTTKALIFKVSATKGGGSDMEYHADTNINVSDYSTLQVTALSYYSSDSVEFNKISLYNSNGTRITQHFITSSGGTYDISSATTITVTLYKGAATAGSSMTCKVY